jgi:hypothetical protein
MIRTLSCVKTQAFDQFFQIPLPLTLVARYDSQDLSKPLAPDKGSHPYSLCGDPLVSNTKSFF